ncbi:glutathione S-transferase family protein [Merismopedia glauca]|uniref:Glutathione S-transferase family protein n=1 Tax=Merismopedia glauca CCAP 1448/3 TaxID=1296344 RepID=A0A2T1C8J6_9CYAN|nr:glutathione S-transferase family protein [Merismopedia glauca]PSB04569.1 glutathione S-transferase family protein [Merismopedia glauca CCAP 1448/3]
MIELYHAPISPNSNRVWMTLLEKGLEFELVEVKLNGEQFQPEFLAISPFHHIPVVVDGDVNLVESLAILDYLEAKYPTPKMLPTKAEDLAIVRMVQFVTVNELLPAMSPFLPVMLGFPGDAEKMEKARQKMAVSLQFLENLLDDRPFFGSNDITLAESVAGTVIPWLARIDIDLNNYPKLTAWRDRIIARPTWQKAQPTAQNIAEFKPIMAARMGL